MWIHTWYAAMFSKLTTSVKIFLLQFAQTPVALFNSLYKVVLMSETVNEILKCDHSNESYIAAVLSCSAVTLFLSLWMKS